MSVTKNPAIDSLDPGSLCHSIYAELYNQFFNAQDRRDGQHPWGVEEGDDTSVRLHNAAYGFAYAIAGAVDGSGQGNPGGILLEYLQKAGGDMSGFLRANYGFEAGTGNHKVLEAFSEEGTDGIRMHGALDLYGGLHFAGREIFSYIYETDGLCFKGDSIDFGAGTIRSAGEFISGSRDTGVYISHERLLVAGNPVFHKGNANLESVDWKMLNARICGDLSVSGQALLSGPLRALNGAELGVDGRVMVAFREDEMTAACNLSLAQSYGIRIGGMTVLGRVGASDIMVGGMGGDLLLGSGDTNKIKLLSAIMDTDADYTLLSPYGAAYFPDSLTVRHNYGDILFSSYRADSADEGVIIHKKLRMGSVSGPCLYMADQGVALHSFFEYTDNGTVRKAELETVIRYGVSASLFSPRDRTVGALMVETQADSILFAKPVETKTHFAIEGSLTRLAAGSLFFNDAIGLLAIADGIKHYGNAYFLSGISSELFSSGFAGSGWAIRKNTTTGNTTATFDELTVRKRMRVYELEIERSAATNGALWITDSFCGDTVTRIY